MSEKTALSSGRTYRGLTVVSVPPSPTARTLVIGTANRQAVTLYECDGISEAYALIDAALPDGGARTDGFVTELMLTA